MSNMVKKSALKGFVSCVLKNELTRIIVVHQYPIPESALTRILPWVAYL